MNFVWPDIPRFDHPARDPDKSNVVLYWGFFSKEDLARNEGALLMLDIDFGRKCSLRCPSCFRKANAVDDKGYPDLAYSEILAVLDDARSIGLREVKICGAGEPLENGLLLDFARHLTERGIGLAIFTKAHVLGGDRHVAALYGKHGIRNARTLCQEFFRLKTSFLVSFQSFDPRIQDKLVGGVDGYTLTRNRGLELLAETGFNLTLPTRLAMCANPIVRGNYKELFEIYVYGRERNILPVNAALMVSSKRIDDEFLAEHDVTMQEKQDLFMRIYRYNLDHGINTAAQLKREGISCMPGVHPCNQLAAGLYLTSNGSVIRCPGDSSSPLGNVHDNSIIEIWENHRNWPYARTFNCHCPYKDGVTLPNGLYDRVWSELPQETHQSVIGGDK